jgi:ferric-dicitrate binding protein FerR (iron transport regulator)
MRANRTTLLATVSLLGLLALSCSPAQKAKPASPAPGATPAATAAQAQAKLSQAAFATVAYLEGSATITEGGGTKAAELGAAVGVAATVSTAAASRCDLKIGSLGTLRLMPLSVVELSALELGEARRSFSAKLLAGTVAAKVDKLASRDRFGIGTTTAFCSVRGTEFVVALASGGSMRVAVKEGAVAVLPPALDPAAFQGSPAAEAFYAAVLAAVPAVAAGQEALIGPELMAGPTAAWAKAEEAIAPLIAKEAGAADPAALLASAPLRQALSPFTSAEAPLAAAAKKASAESVKDFAQFDSMSEPGIQPPQPRPESPSTPQSKKDSIPLTTIDDFKESAFEADVNQNKWSIEGNTAVVAPRQRDGAMRFEQTSPASADTDLYLVAKQPGQFPLREARSLEGKLTLGTDANSGFSHIAINFRVHLPSGEGDYWIECDLMNMGDRLEVLCTASLYNNGNDRTECRKDYYGDLALGKAYALRIDLDPDSGNIAWFLDGREIARGNSPTLVATKDRAAEIILNSFRSKGSFVTTRADEVAFARAP